jgi:hypothetical protein
MGDSTPSPSAAAIARAEKLTRERFVHEGETTQEALAPGSARRRALDAALAEADAGLKVPSLEWRRSYSLLLGLERLLSEEEPHLVDGTVLSAHQVDALSGTLTALLAEAQRNGNGNGASAAVGDNERDDDLSDRNGSIDGGLMDDESAASPGDVDDVEDDEDEEEAAELDEPEPEDVEPQDWRDPEGELDADVAAEGAPDDPGADRRFWFEHATGAGKTVAALGFVEA